MAGSDIMIEILKGMRKEMRERFTNERLDVVESTLLTLARQQRIFMKHTVDLEGRVGKLERR